MQSWKGYKSQHSDQRLPEACAGTLSGKLALSSDTQSTEPGPSPLISIGQFPNLDEKSFAQLVHFDAQLYSTDFSD